MVYLGIVIEQCLRDPGAMERFQIVASRRGRAWTFHLVSVPEDRLDEQIRYLQQEMVTDDYWYAHFFAGESLIVVYRDAVFQMTVDPATWTAAVQHGLKHGIPPEQLDFRPRTLEEAQAFFHLGKA